MMAWCWICNKPLSEPMLTWSSDAYICGTRGRWVNALMRGLFCCLFPKLQSNEEDKHQNNIVQCWRLCHNWLDNCDAHTWKVVSNSWDIDFIPNDIHSQSCKNPDSKIHGAIMGPTWVLSAPDGPHDGPMYLAIREGYIFHSYSIEATLKVPGTYDTKIYYSPIL